MANTTYTTTGLTPLTIGSTELINFSAFLGSLFWDLTGGSATLLLADPQGTAYSVTGTIAGGGGFANWAVVGPAGNWTRAWKLVDASGVIQYSRPIAFAVIS